MNIFILSTLLLILANFIIAQDKSLPKDLSDAISLIDGKEYSSAIVRLRTIRDNHADRYSLIDYLIIKCNDELNKFDTIESLSRNFMLLYPESKYYDDIKLFLIRSLIKQNKYEEGFTEAINYLKKSHSISKKIELKTFIEKSVLGKLNSEYLKQYSENETDRSVHPFILYITAKSYYLNNDIQNGEKFVNKITSNYLASDEYLPAVNLKLQWKTESVSDDHILVGVMFPLTNSQGEKDLIVEYILDGVKYAFHEYNKERSDKIGIVIEDTRCSSEDILRIIKNFNLDKKIKCVIGPVYSNESAELIKNIKLTDLIFVSPTATDEYLTENNDQFYQANPPFDLRGKAFAQYAYFVESRRKFAVINSIEGYSTIMASSFVNEIKKFGGQIVLKETFKNLSTDLPSVISKLRPRISELDGIYLPISQSKDAELLISELEKLNIKVPIFGTQDWLQAKGLEASTTINNLIRITSDYFIDYKDKRFSEFSKAYSKALGKEPNHYNLYGYDAAKHILTTIRSTSSNRYSIKQKLNSGLKTIGYKNNISFSSKRRNTFLNILRFSDGKFSLVERFSTNE